MADEGLPRAPGVPVTEPSLCGYGVLLAALILGYAGVHVLLLLPALRGGLSDFGAFYYPAARAILAGRSPYVVAGLIYPPLLPFLILPVALLPATSARIVWFALSHLFAAVAGVRVWRGLRGGGRAAALVVAAAWATSGALFEDLREGQVNTLILLLVVAVLFPAPGRERLSLAALGAAIGLKVWPGVVLLVDVVQRRWNAIARACGVAALLVGLPWLVVGCLLPGPARPQRSDFWAGSPGVLNGSAPGIVLRLLEPPVRGAAVPRSWVVAHSVAEFTMTSSQAAISLSVSAVLFGAGAVVLAGRARPGVGTSARPVLGAAFIALALFAAPVVWPHYHVVQLPGVAILGVRYASRRSWGRLAVLGFAVLASGWAMAVILGPYVVHFGVTVVSTALLWTLTSLPAAGAAVVLVLLLGELKREACESTPMAA